MIFTTVGLVIVVAAMALRMMRLEKRIDRLEGRGIGGEPADLPTIPTPAPPFTRERS